MPRHKVPLEPDRRSDYGSYKTQDRDWDGWEFVGSMKWVRADTLGERWDPLHQKALVLSKEQQQQRAEQRSETGRGGKRTGLPWPQEYTDRMNATLRIVYKWEKLGFVKRWQPWGGQPQWISLTEQGLAERQLLPWHEVDWPGKEEIRHDDRYFLSHIHRVNQMRVRLLAGAANVPEHEWISERAIDARFPLRESGVLRPHLADGELLLKEDGSWPIKIGDEIVEEISMKAGQKIGIEVELTRKDFLRLNTRILPSLLEQYDFVWYFADPKARQAIYTARGEHVSSEEDRKRIRIMLLDEYLERGEP